MTHKPLLIKGGRILDPSQALDVVGDVLIVEGRIAWAGRSQDPQPEECAVLDATGLVVCPGFIDLHCHLREPGYEDKETIATGTRAAARGGFTTICCMSNTDPAIDSVGIVEFVQRRAATEGVVRVLPIATVSRGRLGKQLSEMEELAEAGVVGFSDDGSPVADANLMRSALLYARALDLPIIEHCEESALVGHGVMHEGMVSSRLGLTGAPAAAEESMAARDIALAALTGGWVHLAHISTAGTLELVRRAKAQGLRVTAEATPHHLTMCDEWVLGQKGQDGVYAPLSPSAYDTFTKVNPPLRSRQDMEALAQGLREGIIDAIATDHAPHTQVDKLVTYDEAVWGISVLETALGSLMGLVHQGVADINTVIDRLTAGPARLLGKSHSYLGTLPPGAAGDVVVFDPDAEWTVDPQRFASKGKNTPLAGATLKGKVMYTIYGGQVAYDARQEGGLPSNAEK